MVMVAGEWACIKKCISGATVPRLSICYNLATMQETHPSTGTDQKDTQDNRLVAAMGYLFILCLLPLLGKKESKFAQFHGKQGLALTIGAVVLWFAGFVLAFIPFLGWLAMFLGWIALVVLAIMGIMNALAGKYWEMPFFGKYAKEIKL